MTANSPLGQANTGAPFTPRRFSIATGRRARMLPWRPCCSVMQYAYHAISVSPGSDRTQFIFAVHDGMLTCERGTKGFDFWNRRWPENHPQPSYPKPFTPETATKILPANAFFRH